MIISTSTRVQMTFTVGMDKRKLKLDGLENLPNKVIEIEYNQDEEKLESIHRESSWTTAIQLFCPFLLAGLGMVAASYMLDVVQYWPVYKNIPEMYILVIALLGLKGNLEMTLASRLSTHANLGHLDDKYQKMSLIRGNIALVLCQAIVVGFLASLAANLFGWMSSEKFQLDHAILLCFSSVITAFCASLILGIVMVTVVLLSRKFNVNPDNIATPIAATLGDLTTLAILSWIAIVCYKTIKIHPQIPASLIFLCLCSAPFWAWIAGKNEFTRKVLYTGWQPVISAMIISSVGGLILDVTLSQFKRAAIFQLIINGIGGNLVAVQTSRISTELHHIGSPGVKTDSMIVCVTPYTAFFRDTKFIHGKTARILLCMAVPGHILFYYVIINLKFYQVSSDFIFLIVYLTAALLQVAVLLYFSQLMTLSMWKKGIDPDSSAIPYLTALGDLIGTLLLGMAFNVLFLIGDKNVTMDNLKLTNAGT